MTSTTRQVTHLYRYPVKGLSAEPLDQARIEVGSGFPLNRMYALALSDTPFDPAAPAPLPKTRFLMLQRDEQLARLQTSYDEQSGELTIARAGDRLLVADLGTAAGRGAVEDFFADFLGDRIRGRPRLVAADGFQFTDVSVVSETMMRAVSLINLASLEALSAAVGKPLHHLRFRANIYFSGSSPWEEFDWVGREIDLGGVRGRVRMRTQRCAATQVNPLTAERDCNVPLELRRAFGHSDLGVYVEIERGGLVRIGDGIAPA